MRRLSRTSQIVLAILVVGAFVLAPAGDISGQPAPTSQPQSAPANPQSEIRNPQSARLTLTGEVAERVEGLEKQIEELHEQGKYAEAIPLAEEVLAIRREHQSGWTNAKGEPAEWYEVGDARRAVEDLRMLMTLTPEQLAELEEARELDAQEHALHQQGKYGEAAQLQLSQLEIHRRVLGDNHPETLSSIHDMGYLLESQGNLAEAEGYYREALEGRRRVLGDDHPHRLTSMNHVGALLQSRGKLAGGEPYYREALEGRRRVLGDDHQSTLISISNMGALLEAQGKLAEAEPYFREALEGFRRVLGDDHPYRLTSIKNMGWLFESMGKYEEAEPYYREALEGSRRLLGDDHPDTLESINKMGVLLHYQGKPAEAEPYVRQALEGRRRVLGDDHPHTLVSIGNMGSLLKARGKLAEAQAYRREVLEGQRRVLGDDHPQTLTSIDNMGVLLQDQGKLEEALGHYREALEGRRRRLGDDHPHTLGSINNMGNLLYSQGKLAEAEGYWREALEGSRRVLGDDHAQTLNSVNNMGVLLQAQGKLAEAEPYIREALEGRRRVLGDDHPHTLISIGNMGSLLEAQGKLAEAEPYIREALGVAERLRTTVVGEERGRAAYADKLRLSGIAARLASLLIQTSRPAEAWSVAERGRSRALLDLLARSDQDLLEAARARASGDQAAVAALETSVHKEQQAKADLTTTEALLATMQKQRKHTEGRDDLSEEEKGTRLAKLDQQISEQKKAVEFMRRTLAEAGADVLIQLRGLFPDARPMKIGRIRAGLERGELALGFTWTDESVLLLAAPAAGDGDVQGLILAKSEEEVKALTELARQVRDSIAERPADSTSAAYAGPGSKLLAKLIPDAIRKQVGTAKRLIILPDGPLHGIPFEALGVGGSEALAGKPPVAPKLLLGAGPQILYAGSATMYLNRRAVARRQSDSGVASAVVLGDPILEREPTSPPAYPNQGVLIAMVGEGTNAAKAGLRRGDVVLGYGGKKTKDFDALVASLGEIGAAVKSGKHKADDRIPITYWRAGKTLEATLAPGKMGVRLDRGAPDSGLRLMAMRSRGHDQAVAEISATDHVRLHGGALWPLPGTQREGVSIARTITAVGGRAVTLLGKDATIARLESAVEGKRYVHLATHGLTGSRDRPYDASLALTQPQTPTPDDIGFLTLDHLITRWRGKLEGCDLVVLSACDTQRGVRKGTGIMALPWGFMYAGAPTVVASLWKVDDTATALLMQRFYENLLGQFTKSREVAGRAYPPREGLPKADALREAKLWLRSLTAEKAYELAAALPGGEARGTVRERLASEDSLSEHHPYAHPYYWAAFILIGDPG